MKQRTFRKNATAWLCLIFLCLSILTGCSQTAKTDTSPLFWKVESESNTVYFLGSIHVGTPDIYPLDAVIMDAYRKSDYLVLEMDVTSEPVEMKYGQGKLEELLGADLLGRTIVAIKEQNPEITDEELAAAGFMDLMGWLVPAVNTEIGLSSQYGVDTYFLQKAIKDKKGLTGVETFSQSAEDIAKYPPEYMAYVLEARLAAEAYEENVKLQFAQWCVGDEAAIEGAQSGYLREEKDRSELNKFLYDFMILERNSRMLQKAEECLKAHQTTFFILGLAHLLGEEGVISQLEDLGYNVERISTK